MKITKDFTRKDGVRTVTVQLAVGEKLMTFKDDSCYPSKRTSMKITKDFTRKDGVRTVTVQLAVGEKLMTFKDDSCYRLGGQVDEIVGGYCIIGSPQVMWCSIEQKWVDA